MNKQCKQCQAAFEVTDEDLVFYDKVSPVFNGALHLLKLELFSTQKFKTLALFIHALYLNPSPSMINT